MGDDSRYRNRPVRIDVLGHRTKFGKRGLRNGFDENVDHATTSQARCESGSSLTP